MRFLAFAFALAATPLMAQDHLAEANGLRVLHAWTPATPKGTDALIYMEIENTSATEVLLTGGTAEGQALPLAGFGYGAAGAAWTDLPGLPIAPGGELRLEPQVLALRWPTVPLDLTEGADVEIAVHLGTETLQAHVEIGAPGATAHSHAGHGH